MVNCGIEALDRFSSVLWGLVTVADQEIDYTGQIFDCSRAQSVSTFQVSPVVPTG
jgi:hypothetical protein